ncbi:MAG: hypothetical protein QS2022_0510 [Candidatus Phytoplasma asteris]|nr:MAG: hypothetical protein PLY_0510 [Periwinkle leaf yellowing phytoplasma]WEX19341.1 MAG: hypothetical protein QS2022_0510 [Candidatus Phytoplasma asteris]
MESLNSDYKSVLSPKGTVWQGVWKNQVKEEFRDNFKGKEDIIKKTFETNKPDKLEAFCNVFYDENTFNQYFIENFHVLQINQTNELYVYEQDLDKNYLYHKLYKQYKLFQELKKECSNLLNYKENKLMPAQNKLEAFESNLTNKTSTTKKEQQEKEQKNKTFN